MQIASEPLEPCQVQLTITVDPEDIEQAMQAVARDVAKRQRFPGYRPGAVPYARIAALVGEDALREDAIQRLTRDLPAEAVTQAGLRPVAPMVLEQASEDPLVLRLLVPLAPRIDLGDYLSLRLPEIELPDVDEAAVEAQIETWRQELGELAPVERPAALGDVMRLKLTGRLADAVVYGDDALDLKLDRDAAVAAGLPAAVVDPLVGLSAGDSAAFDVTYSELWPDIALQGRAVSFAAEVDSVSTMTPPPLDDALAQRLGLENLDELRSRVRAQTVVRALYEMQDRRMGQALDLLMAQADVLYPPQLLAEEIQDMAVALRERVEKQGFTWERWLELQDKGEEGLWNDLEREAELRLRRSLVLGAFGEAERVGLDPDALDAEMDRYAAMAGPALRKGGKEGRKAIRREVGARMLSGQIAARLLAIMSGRADEPGDDAAAVLPFDGIDVAAASPADEGAAPDAPPPVAEDPAAELS